MTSFNFDDYLSVLDDVENYLNTMISGSAKSSLPKHLSSLKYWSILGTYGRSKYFKRNAKEITDSSDDVSYGFGIRFYFPHYRGLISTNDLDNWKKVLDQKLTLFSNANASKFGKEDYSNFDFDSQENDDSQLKQFLRDKENYSIGKTSDFTHYSFKAKKDPFDLSFDDINSMISFDFKNYLSYFGFSKGHRVFIDPSRKLMQSTPRTVLFLNLTDGESYFDKQAVIGGYEHIDSNELFNRSVKSLSDLNHAKSLTPKKYDVVADGDLSGVFIHEAFGHASEADHLFMNATVLKGKLNSSLAGNFVTVHDSPIPPVFPQWGSYFFDDEGTFAKDTVIIDKGKFKTFLHSKVTANKFARLNVQNDINGQENHSLNASDYFTANGRAEDYSYLPIVRMTNTYFQTSDWNDDELLDIKEGLFLKGSRGGQVSPTSGDFQFNSVVGYYVKNGEILYPVKGASLIGNTLETLKNIDAVGNKYHNSLAGFCGKDGQSVPVQGYNPYTRIRHAHIGFQK